MLLVWAAAARGCSFYKPGPLLPACLDAVTGTSGTHRGTGVSFSLVVEKG